MAYSYSVTEFEVDDKVVAQCDIEDEDGEHQLSIGTVVTIKSKERSVWNGDDGYILTFEEVDGQYRDEHFQLHESVTVRT